eukprot:s1020_g4.t1
MAELDSQVGEYINHLYQEGEAVTRAGWLLSGLRRFYPRLRRELCLAQQWYNNWTREHVPARATPMPWRVAQSMVGLCRHEGWFHLGVCILIGFAFFLRTQELLTLRVSDIEANLNDGSLVVRLERTKTSRQHLQSLTLSHPALTSLVVTLLSSVSSDWLWPWSSTYFRRCFSSLCDFFHLSSFNFVPYSLRRGGATHFYMCLQALDFVMVQGRWKDQRTCRLYVDDARAMLDYTLPSGLAPQVLFEGVEAHVTLRAARRAGNALGALWQGRTFFISLRSPDVVPAEDRGHLNPGVPAKPIG